MIYLFEKEHPFGDFNFNSNKKIDSDKNVILSEVKIDYDETNYNLENKVIKLRKECAINNLKSQLKENENLQEFKFGVITTDTKDISKGTPILQAKTNKRAISIIYNHRILTATGTVELRKSEYLQPKPVLKNPLVALLVKELAKAVAKEVANKLFEEYFPNDKDSEITQQLENLKEEIQKLFEQYKYDAFEDVLITNRKWLRDTYSERLNSVNQLGISSIDWNETIHNLTLRQEKIKGIVDIIETRLSDNEIKDCSYMARTKGYLHAACSAMRIILFKEEVFLRQLAINEGLVTYSIDSYKSELEHFIKHAETEIRKNAKGFKDGRFAFITSVYETKDIICHRTPESHHTTCVEYKGYNWRDDFESSESKDPFIGGKIKRFYGYSDGKNPDKDQKNEDAKKDRKNHYDAVLKLMNLHVTVPYEDLITKLENCKVITT